MPIHVVAAHLAVILAPICALLALAYAVRPNARAALRWPLVASAAAALAAVIWSAEAGKQLYAQLKEQADAAGSALPPAVFAHAHGSDVLTLAVFALAALVAVFSWWLLRPDGARSVPALVAATLLGIAAASTLAATGIVLARAMAAVWSQHPLYN